jgi:hypothetical protein
MKPILENKKNSGGSFFSPCVLSSHENKVVTKKKMTNKPKLAIKYKKPTLFQSRFFMICYREINHP